MKISLAQNECFERALPLNKNSEPSEIIKMMPYFTQAPVPPSWLRPTFKALGEGRPGRLGELELPQGLRWSQAPAQAKLGSGRRPMRSCLLSILEGRRRRLKTMVGPSALPPNHAPAVLA